MQTYTCPTCGEKMERDLTVFSDHTDKHILEELKKKNPAWITPDGFCAKCLEHYQRARLGLDTTNLDAGGIRQRILLGVAGFGAALPVYWWLKHSQAPAAARLALFPLLFFGFLGLLQAQKKLCVVIAQKQSAAIRRRALWLLVCAVVLSALLTAASYL